MLPPRRLAPALFLLLPLSMACSGDTSGEPPPAAAGQGGAGGAGQGGAGGAGATAGKGGSPAGGKAGSMSGGSGGSPAAGAGAGGAGQGGAGAGGEAAGGAGAAGAGQGGEGGTAQGGQGGAGGEAAGQGGAGQGGAGQGGAGAGGEAAAGASGAGAGGGAGASFGEDPVIFVHGYGVPGSWWDPAVDHFNSKGGYPKGWVRKAEFKDVFGSIIDQAKELSAQVEAACAELGVERVDIVSHSMGGLTTRWYIAFEGGNKRVRDYVSFSGALHGTGTACVTLGEGAQQMCPAYSDKDTTVQWKLNGDPGVADVDETPFGVEDGGQVYWNVFWSDGDLIILPNESACLNQKQKDDCSDPVNTLFKGVLHSQMNSHEGMLSEALVRVKKHNPAAP